VAKARNPTKDATTKAKVVDPPTEVRAVVEKVIDPQVVERLSVVERRLKELERERIAYKAQQLGRRLFNLAEAVDVTAHNHALAKNVTQDGQSDEQSGRTRSRSGSDSDAVSNAPEEGSKNVEREATAQVSNDTTTPAVTWTSWLWSLPGVVGRSLVGSTAVGGKDAKDDR
jgi:hypothetical protein